jgi:hypothetical protein
MRPVISLSVIVVAIAVGCKAPTPSRSSRRSPTDSIGRSPQGLPVGVWGLLSPGARFDLRAVGGVLLTSPVADSLPCAARPPIAEELEILDSARYSITRVAESTCDHTPVEIRDVAGTYRLMSDTVRFYHGDGNEAEVSFSAIVTPDSLIGIGQASGGRLAYSRRHGDQAGQQVDPRDLATGNYSHFVQAGPGDTLWAAVVHFLGREAMIRFGYKLGRNSQDRSYPTAIVDSVRVQMVPNEMPYDNCGVRDGPRGTIIAFVNRGPEDPVARLAWRASQKDRRLIPVPVADVHCIPGAYGD